MKTNKQIINALSKDAIDSAFVITAVEWYAREVMQIRDEGEWKHSFINLNLWKTIAEHALETIEGRSVVK